MNFNDFRCPNCHGKLTKKSNILVCRNCLQKFSLSLGIAQMLPKSLPQKLATSQRAYEHLHKKIWGKLADGSYEILASFARGNKTLDIACGEGYIEKLTPHTVGLEFSINALKKARKMGVRNLVQGVAESLPFRDQAFDMVICAGSLEHFADPQKALFEIARVSKIQILTVHRPLPIPFGKLLLPVTRFVFGIFHQPIERPFSIGELEKMYKKAGLTMVFKGIWTFPVNFGNVIPFLPVLTHIPSCHFVISYKQRV